ncbi:MAG TPA: sigma-70 family RNA polymerase sigma factor [Actinomycetota bacterium]|nr:sigma-70 family RNA polymerase sigma factor [Actinomycetota bacterium]
MDDTATRIGVERVGALAPPVGGATAEFEAFFRANHADVFACFRLLARDAADAEEIAQEAFLRVWQRWDRVAAMERPDGYLYRTAMNVWRSRRRRAAVALRRLGRRVHDADAPTGGGVPAADDRDAVVRALAGLPSRQRAAFVLTEGLDLTSEEAGLAMGIAASTVRVLLARASAALRPASGTGANDG